MTRTAQLAVLGLLTIGGFGMIGCTIHAGPPEVVVGAPPVGYVYEDDYYGRGHWDGDYWMWRDRDGHMFRERREIHDQRIRERGDRDHGDRDHGDHEHDHR